MTAVIDYEIHGPVALIAINNPQVNAMGIAVRQGKIRIKCEFFIIKAERFFNEGHDKESIKTVTYGFSE